MPGLLSSYLFVYQGRSSVSSKFSRTLQVKLCILDAEYPWFSVCTAYLSHFVFEICRISYLGANSVMYLKLCFVFYQVLQLFQLEKLFRIPNLPHSPNWKSLWWLFQPIPLFISFITSHCFLYIGSVSCFIKVECCLYASQNFLHQSITYRKQVYRNIPSLGDILLPKVAVSFPCPNVGFPYLSIFDRGEMYVGIC